MLEREATNNYEGYISMLEERFGLARKVHYHAAGPGAVSPPFAGKVLTGFGLFPYYYVRLHKTRLFYITNLQYRIL